MGQEERDGDPVTSRAHLVVNAAVVLMVVLNILLTVYHYGRLTQTVLDLSQRVTRLEQTIDYWRDSGRPMPVPQQYIYHAKGGA